jgi:alpha-glucoside transport system permease protein
MTEPSPETTPDAPGGLATGGGAVSIDEPTRRPRFTGLGTALAFLLPALVLLGALVLYPIVATVIRSLYDRSGDQFIGLGNYSDALTSHSTLNALRNNLIWVVVAPSIVTALGLVFAVLSERVRWSTAFKLVVFMPMAISFLAAGVIFRLVYEQSPERGLANAVVTSVTDLFRAPGPYVGARTRPESVLKPSRDGFVTTDEVTPGRAALLPLVGLPPAELPDDARAAAAPDKGGSSGIDGVVWLDFARGGGGDPGVVDSGEKGLPGIDIDALVNGKVAASTTTADDGSFHLDVDGPATLRLGSGSFRAAFGGVKWLGPTLVTPSIIGAYIWIWAGFAMVVIGAGLAAIPREALEAARVDGANEWQVFRRVTVPLLSPVLIVVLVTLMINVLKVFDLVFIIPPGSVQDDANVLALEMWRVSFGGAQDQGLGSALGVILFLLVLPAMLFNIRRFRQDTS